VDKESGLRTQAQYEGISKPGHVVPWLSAIVGNVGKY